MRHLVVSLVILGCLTAQADTFFFAIDDFPPYIEREAPGYGLAPRLIEAALDSQSHQVEFHFVPWPRAYRMAQEGQTDGSFPWSNFGDRQRQFAVSVPILRHDISLVFTADQYRPWHSYPDLDGLKFGTVAGYAIGGDLYDWIAATDQSLETVNSEALLFRMLAHNRFDAAAFDQVAARAYIQSLEAEVPAVASLIVEDRVIESAYSYVLMPLSGERTEQLAAALAAGFTTIRGNGTYNAIVAEYLPR